MPIRQSTTVTLTDAARGGRVHRISGAGYPVSGRSERDTTGKSVPGFGRSRPFTMTAALPHYINSRSRLTPLLEAVRGSDRVAFDTEFISEGSYEPLLCLVQVATQEGSLWIVDPLAVADLGEFWRLVTEPEREVIVLAAREELRFCLRYAGRAPERMVDVQVAAGLVGQGYPVSHTNLVRKVLGVQIGGGEAYTDWRQRPLSNRQLEYAADDVRYLFALRDRLMEDAERLGRTAWIEAECRRLVERVTAGEQEERWWKLAGGSTLSRRDLAVLRELWRWRDAEARGANQPPRRIMRDDLLVEIAKRRPTTVNNLFALRGMDRGAARDKGPEIVRAVQAALALPDAELPRHFRRDDPPQVAVLAQLLSVVTNNVSAEEGVDLALLATTAELQDLVRWRLGLSEREGEPEVLSGWRGSLLGQPLLQILNGEAAVRVADLNAPGPLAFEPATASEDP